MDADRELFHRLAADRVTTALEDRALNNEGRTLK